MHTLFLYVLVLMKICTVAAEAKIKWVTSKRRTNTVLAAFHLAYVTSTES